MNVSNVFHEPAHTHKHILFIIMHDGLMGLWSMEALSLSPLCIRFFVLMLALWLHYWCSLRLSMTMMMINAGIFDVFYFMPNGVFEPCMLWDVQLIIYVYMAFHWMDCWKNQNASLTCYIISSSILSNLSSSLRRKDFVAQVGSYAILMKVYTTIMRKTFGHWPWTRSKRSD